MIEAELMTRPPKDDDCPWNWAWNKKSGCCIPPKEVCERDCGEGYVFNKNKLRCERKEVNKCGKGKWYVQSSAINSPFSCSPIIVLMIRWHDRNKECCDFDWGWDQGDCPKGKKCPKREYTLYKVSPSASLSRPLTATSADHTDWHWSKKDKRCKPDTPRAPEPDCDDWNEHGGRSLSNLEGGQR